MNDIIIDARFDSYREGNVWTMFKNIEKNWYFIKSMRIEAKEMEKGKLA